MDKIEPAFTLIWDAARNGYFVNKPNIGTTDCFTREQVTALLSENARLREALEALFDAADESDGCCYGTLSTSFVREIARAALSAQEDA